MDEPVVIRADGGAQTMVSGRLRAMAERGMLPCPDHAGPAAVACLQTAAVAGGAGRTGGPSRTRRGAACRAMPTSSLCLRGGHSAGSLGTGETGWH